MAATMTEPRVEEEEERYDAALVDGDCGDHGGVVAREAAGRRVSRLAVEGGRDQAGDYSEIGGRGGRPFEKREQVHRRCSGGGGGRTLPPPHAWLAIEDTRKQSYDSDTEEQWARLLSGGGGGAGREHVQQQRRSSFSVVRRERAAREVSLDRAWEMKRNWHERNGGAPDADTPVVVMVGRAAGGGHGGHASPSSPSYHQAGAVGGGGVAMDVEEVRACRDLGLELPHDCTVEIQCYGISGGSSPSRTAGSSGTDSPGSISSPAGADPTDVKARLKVWAQAVALASTTHLGS